MDYISPNNIFSISSCDLNTKFNDRSHADWSQTNLISFVTLDGIYILKPHLEQLNAPFEIQLIGNPVTKFRHAPFEKHSITLDESSNSLDNKRYMEAYLDPAIATNATKLSMETYPRRYRLARWSPPIDTYPRQCLLSVLTVDYQLMIFRHRDGVWAFDKDLSQLYDNIWMQTELSSNIKDNSFEAIRANSHSLSFGAICWKQLDNDNLFLVTTTLSGDIVLWKLILTPNTDDYFQKEVTTFTVKYILRTSQTHINMMQFCEDLLITSSRKGQVSLYDLSLIFEELMTEKEPVGVRRTNPHKRQAVANPTISEIEPTTILWHQDNIEVADFFLQPISTNNYRIVLAKATNICWCTIHYKPRSSTEPVSLAISDTFSAIDGLDPDVSLHQTPATWLKPAGEKKAVMIADDGSFFQLEFFDTQHDTSPVFNAIRTGKIDLTDMIPRGLCCSPNGHLTTMISSITFMVDPLKVPAPTKLILLPTQNEKSFFLDCLRNILDESWLDSQKVTSPMDVRDSIDCVLSMFPHLNSSQSFRFHMILKEEITNVGKPTTTTQFVKLKIISFILSKFLGVEGFKQSDELQEELEKTVYNVILLDHIQKMLDSTLNKESLTQRNPPGALNEAQLNSLRNYMSWLDKSLDGQEIRDKYKEQFNELIVTKYKPVPYEICSICQCDIPFESYKYGACTNKHQFVRCSRSLLVLDFSRQDRLQCSDCRRSYMAKLIWPTSNLWLCMYCQ